MTLSQPQRVLALAPHTDDAELGAGGALARYLEEGADVRVEAFSSCPESLPGLPDDRLAKEFAASMHALGIAEDNWTLHDYPVRRFDSRRQEILDRCVEIRREFRPDLVVLPCSTDRHQDHHVLHTEGLRAFARHASILGYEIPWNMGLFRRGHMVRLEQRHLDAKLQCLALYVSQVELARPYFDPRFFEGLARVRGVQCGAEFAEAFEAVSCVS